jgi:hypothetical protein
LGGAGCGDDVDGEQCDAEDCGHSRVTGGDLTRRI